MIRVYEAKGLKVRVFTLWFYCKPNLATRCSSSSDVSDLEEPHEQVQVSDAGGLEQLGSVHQRERHPQGRPDVGRHLLLAAALAPPLLVQSRQEVPGCFPTGSHIKSQIKWD